VLIHQALGFEFTDTIKIIIISSEIIKWILEIQILIRKKKKKEILGYAILQRAYPPLFVDLIHPWTFTNRLSN
jgi:hypothetical protein